MLLKRFFKSKLADSLSATLKQATNKFYERSERADEYPLWVVFTGEGARFIPAVAVMCSAYNKEKLEDIKISHTFAGDIMLTPNKGTPFYVVQNQDAVFLGMQSIVGNRKLREKYAVKHW